MLYILFSKQVSLKRFLIALDFIQTRHVGVFLFDWHFRIYCYVTSHHKLKSLQYCTFIFMKRFGQQIWMDTSGFKLLAGLSLYLEALEENNFEIHSYCKNLVPRGCWFVVHIFL